MEEGCDWDDADCRCFEYGVGCDDYYYCSYGDYGDYCCFWDENNSDYFCYYDYGDDYGLAQVESEST